MALYKCPKCGKSASSSQRCPKCGIWLLQASAPKVSLNDAMQMNLEGMRRMGISDQAAKKAIDKTLRDNRSNN